MPPLTGREKATIFLSLLGAETSARLMRYLPLELADLVASSVNHLPKPSPQAVASILEELRSFISLPPAPGSVPVTVVSSRNSPAAGMYSPSPPAAPPPPPEKPKTPDEKFEQAAARKLASIFLYERAQIVAFALMLMSAEKQLEILNNLPGQRPLVETLLRDHRQNGFTEGLKRKIIDYVAEKL
ncbi:MAG: hypothetical protein WC901_01825 [Candidatus Margulisiibacteriota bacterium]